MKVIMVLVLVITLPLTASAENKLSSVIKNFFKKAPQGQNVANKMNAGKDQSGRLYTVDEIRANPEMRKRLKDWVQYSKMTDNDYRVQLWFWILVENRKKLILDGKAHCPIKGTAVCYVAAPKSFTVAYFCDGTFYIMRAVDKLPKGLFYMLSPSSNKNRQGQSSGYKIGSNLTIQSQLSQVLATASAIAGRIEYKRPTGERKVILLPGQVFVDLDRNIAYNKGEVSSTVGLWNGVISYSGYDETRVAVQYSSINDEIQLPSEIKDLIEEFAMQNDQAIDEHGPIPTDANAGIVSSAGVAMSIKAALERKTAEDKERRERIDRENAEHLGLENKGETPPIVEERPKQEVQAGEWAMRILYAAAARGDITDPAVQGGWRNQFESERLEEEARGQADRQAEAAAASVAQEAEAGAFLDSLGGSLKEALGFVGEIGSAMWDGIKTVYDWLTTPSPLGGGSTSSNDDCGYDGCLRSGTDDGGGGDADDDDEDEDNNPQNNATSTTTTDDAGTPTDTAVGSGAEYAGPGPEDQPESDTAVVQCMSEDCERYRSHCEANPGVLECQGPISALDRAPFSNFSRSCQQMICDGEGGCICAGGGSSTQYGAYDLLKDPGTKLFAKLCQNQMCPMENPGCCGQRSSLVDLALLRQRILTNICRYMMTNQGNCSGVSDRAAYCKDNPSDVRCRPGMTNSPSIPVPPPRSFVNIIKNWFGIFTKIK